MNDCNNCKNYCPRPSEQREIGNIQYFSMSDRNPFNVPNGFMPDSCGVYEHITSELSSFDSQKLKEDEKMSSLVVFKGQSVFYIVSDSHSSLCNGETDRIYKKLFAFKNGVFGVTGVNNTFANNVNENIGDYILSKINGAITEDEFTDILQNISNESDLGEKTEVILLLQENNNVVYTYYVFNATEFTQHKYKKLQTKSFHPYAKSFLDFSKGNNEFMNAINKDVEGTLKRSVRFMADFCLFRENTRIIGGPVQMFKVPFKGNVENLSEPPFDV